MLDEVALALALGPFSGVPGPYLLGLSIVHGKPRGSSFVSGGSALAPD
jgi:hypothetical protein